MAGNVFDAFHLIRPWWLLGLVPVLGLVWLWAKHSTFTSRWESAIEPELLSVLLEPIRNSGVNLTVWIVGAALVLATIGVAGPSWERLPQPVTQKGDAAVIVIDLSLSMFAKDVAPSRLTRARQKITDMLRSRQEGFTALVSYAGDAHIVTPLTDDTGTIQNLLAALSPDMMPVFGSNVSGGITLARELFKNAGFQQGRIILVTDGVERAAWVTDQRDRDFPISILGVGTEAGGTIPLDFANQPGEVLTTDLGDPVLAHLDASQLASIAEASYGRYRTLGLADTDIVDLIATPLPSDDETSERERDFDTWADMGYWLALALLPVALFGFRRGVLAGLCVVCIAPPAHAGIWQDLWQRHDQQAHDALVQGRPDDAAALFEDPQWRASAQYRKGEFAQAAIGFTDGATVDSMYNAGNAWAKQAEYEQAIAAYSEVLAQQPDHEDAAFNRDLVQRLLEEKESEERENEQEDSPGDPGEANQDQSTPSEPGESSEDTPPNDGDSSSESDQQSGQPEEGDDEQLGPEEPTESRDEQRDALEQWLRRVPDDPGGLLQRKFRYETNQRRQRGEYHEPGTEKFW